MWQRARQVEPQTTQHFWAQAHLGAQAHPQCRLPLPVHRSAARPISTTVPINNGDREGGSAAAEKARVTAIIASRRPTKGIREETATATTVATTVTERKNAVSRKRPTKLRQNTSANTAQLDRDLSANFVQLDHSNPLTGLVAHTACLPTPSQANGAFYLDSGNTCRFNVRYLPTFARLPSITVDKRNRTNARRDPRNRRHPTSCCGERSPSCRHSP